MATSKKIIWHPGAKSELFEILDYYTRRNSSTEYSGRLFAKMEHYLSLVDENWQLGKKINKENVRRMIVENFLIYYLITPESVDVLSVRDGRRKPKKFKMSEIIMNTEPDA